MSDPLSTTCAYCGSRAVLDDAWFCGDVACWAAYEADCREAIAYEARVPLTRNKACGDLMATKAAVWGHPYGDMVKAADRLRAWT